MVKESVRGKLSRTLCLQARRNRRKISLDKTEFRRLGFGKRAGKLDAFSPAHFGRRRESRFLRFESARKKRVRRKSDFFSRRLELKRNTRKNPSGRSVRLGGVRRGSSHDWKPNRGHGAIGKPRGNGGLVRGTHAQTGRTFCGEDFPKRSRTKASFENAPDFFQRAGVQAEGVPQGKL